MKKAFAAFDQRIQKQPFEKGQAITPYLKKMAKDPNRAMTKSQAKRIIAGLLATKQAVTDPAKKKDAPDYTEAADMKGPAPSEKAEAAIEELEDRVAALEKALKTGDKK